MCRNMNHSHETIQNRYEILSGLYIQNWAEKLYIIINDCVIVKCLMLLIKEGIFEVGYGI